uniref:Uncharacterized protein n=1 Tax=Ananas comosus var. bracteatus TaxID=296719 RepID=A0A6V7PRK2_ANACO|nr:unnamed protein product [Ananas comosus var. bracteatus]
MSETKTSAAAAEVDAEGPALLVKLDVKGPATTAAPRRRRTSRSRSDGWRAKAEEEDAIPSSLSSRRAAEAVEEGGEKKRGVAVRPWRGRRREGRGCAGEGKGVRGKGEAGHFCLGLGLRRLFRREKKRTREKKKRREKNA